MIKDILPKEGVEFYDAIKQRALDRGNSEADAEQIAWEVTKTKLVEKEGRLIAMSEAFKPATIYTFQLSEATPTFVTNSENEEIVMEAVLADTDRNTEGLFFAEEDLEDIHAQITLLGSTLPDVDHEKLKELVTKYGRDTDRITEELKKEKGVFKKIKSVLKDGKLWIQAYLDKRYKNHVDKFTGLSIEAFGDKQPDGRVKNPRYLGFTFTNNPKLKSARIVK